MAVTQTTLNPTPTRLPLIAPVGEPDIWWSQYPKAEIVFALAGAAVTVAGIGNTQRLVINCVLPSTFAYVLQDLTLNMTSATDIDDWQSATLTNIRDGNPPIWTQWLPFEGLSTGGHAGITFKTWALTTPPTNKTLLGINPDPRLQVTIDNPVITGEVAVANLFCRFYQYDLNQGYRTAINAPILTR